MSRISVDAERCDRCGECAAACPFGAITLCPNGVTIGDACRFCRLCLKSCPRGALTLTTDAQPAAPDRSDYRGIMVFAEQRDGAIQPVVFELIGKGLALAAQVDAEVSVALVGADVGVAAEELRHYGAARVLVYDCDESRQFRPELYTQILTDAIERVRPGIVLIGATPVGRSLAPRVATRLRTGLTADCTSLEIRPNGDLVQTRPAFGGDVMATILTPRHRPQMATVRYKVMEPAPRRAEAAGEIIACPIPPNWRDRSRVIDVLAQAQAATISDADVIVAAGRGVRSRRDLELVDRLAGALGGMTACTRPLVEQGWLPNTRQVGLSGRAVRPRLYIAVGISGAIQHVAGMRGSDVVVAINQDRNAPIFAVAHYGLVGDLYTIVPELIRALTEGSADHDT